MALLVLLKLLATTTCYASGNAGGIFGPSLFIGAMMGGVLAATAAEPIGALRYLREVGGK